ncbi:MAG: ABC transporter ATP-binding protein [Prolixibacteraceae bacterium]|nr:ABC transporter ATP-binding protein [Prolixibacteraceae bacterium]MBN2649683.1 ABC transporter ATP-binding protein [Prolixibacteraceae bacterium]
MITIKNISKSCGKVEALRDVSLNINQNEIFGLIGPDGAGKTTLMRILVSLLLPDKGSASMGGVDVVKQYRQIRKIVGYMPGRFSLYHDLSVEENLNFFASVFGTTVEANYYLVKDIYQQLEPFKTRRAGKLSGGMKQKLALSCALIHKPEVLVLDEPTTGVDAVSRTEFWDMLGKLKQSGITIFVSTPYMDEASRCDRVALIQGGEIMTVDQPARIVEQYGKRIWNVKSAETYRLLNDLKAWESTTSVYPFGQYLHLSVDESTGKEDIIAYMQSQNHEPYVYEGFSIIEDVFMDLMGKQ